MLCSEALGMSKIKSHSEGVNLIAKTNIIIIRLFTRIYQTIHLEITG